MGAGKTTIGRLLSEKLHYQFLDSDHEIVSRSGADIPWIFDVEGEAGFRKREEQVIDDLTQKNNLVLATGGGAVLSAKNRENLKTRGQVVFLDASIEQQLNRTRKDKNRPLLQAEDPEAVLRSLLEERRPLYLEIADLVISTESGSVRQVLGQILKSLDQ